MKVAVSGFGVMREYLPGQGVGTAMVDLKDGSTVRGLLEELGVPGRLVHMCLVDGARVGMDEELREGAEVTLMPPFSGGAKT